MEQIFGAMSNVLNELGPNAQTREAMVFAAWRRCAGAALSERTFPIEFFGNRLIVAVEDDIWRRHLEDLSPLMISRLNGSLSEGRILFIEFRVEPRRFASLERIHESSDVDLSLLQHSLATAAESIGDPKLRANFLDTAARYLARQGTER